jgi:hypothetical protein|tara:strand:+ start:1594 stop:1779 length:186 start_codon:yes stop_codon:yes gene_type:complete
MENTVLLSIDIKEEGLEVKLKEEAYGNLALVGLLEKIKLEIISGERVEADKPLTSNQKYNA